MKLIFSYFITYFFKTKTNVKLMISAIKDHVKIHQDRTSVIVHRDSNIPMIKNRAKVRSKLYNIDNSKKKPLLRNVIFHLDSSMLMIKKLYPNVEDFNFF